MSVAVLIVNYKGYEDLDRALASLTPVLAADDEVAVVDQESDAAALGRVLATHPRVIALPNSGNSGFAAGVNQAAAQTRAPFLLLLNPDTVCAGPVPRVLETWLRAHPACGVAGPRVLDADGSVQESARRFPGPSTALAGRSTWLTAHFPGNWLTRRNLLAAAASGPITVDWLSGSCFMTRRDLFDRLGGLDEGFFMYWEDADFCRRAATLGLSSMYVPTVEVRHLAGRSAAYDRERSIRAFHASAYRLFRKHYGAFGTVTAPLVRVGLALRAELRVRQSRLAAARAARGASAS
ncbi:MAG TPA: glycosyltransferase family 2 protein [Vicinamibacterales bacterium]|nr:glycosyltransferase family 2 protein [Vicinamibacterales bacterium]